MITGRLLDKFLLMLVLLALVLSGSCPATAFPVETASASQELPGSSSGCRIEIDQPVALIDTPINIQVTGMPPGRQVTLRARSTFPGGQAWEAAAGFAAGEDGRIDLGRDAPLSGSYSGANAMGLFWSMQRVKAPEIPSAGTGGKLDPILVTLTAEAGGETLASAKIQRLFMADGVVRKAVQEDGLVGALYVPAQPGPHPTVIWVGGSEGGLSESYAALLASHGFTALALAYFGIDPLPPELVEIPLEYFVKAIAWLKAQPGVDAGHIAIMGGSRGAELALLLAATYPQDLQAVVAYKPSSVVWMGFRRSPADNFRGPKSSWSSGGQGLPYLNGKLTFDLLKAMFGREAAMRSSFEKALGDPQAAAAAIPVEKIAGPVLLISGTEDQLWPSASMGDQVMARLNERGHPFPDVHLRYEGAGHSIELPYLPATTLKSGNLLLGGSPQANAAASADAWPKVLAFLEENLF